jgi:hypothetical protein
MGARGRKKEKLGVSVLGTVSDLSNTCTYAHEHEHAGCTDTGTGTSTCSLYLSLFFVSESSSLLRFQNAVALCRPISWKLT